MNSKQDTQRHASNAVLQDLIDCLLAEHFFEESMQKIITPKYLKQAYNNHPKIMAPLNLLRQPDSSLIWQWTLHQNPLSIVWIPITQSIVQEFRKTPGTTVYALNVSLKKDCFHIEALDTLSFIKIVINNLSDKQISSPEGATYLVKMLTESVQQTAWSMAHELSADDIADPNSVKTFQRGEQWASLRDRPFHPIAKAKMGLNKFEYHQLLAEFGKTLTIRWVAIAKDTLLCDDPNNFLLKNRPESLLLSSRQRICLSEELLHRKIIGTHIALPVHPWQFQHTLKSALNDAFNNGDCQPLNFQGGDFLSTSSVRSLAPLNSSEHYLKLPMNICSLGSCRDLPARKMINGNRGERLMRQALHVDPILKNSVYLCDESKWWAYMPKGGSLFDAPPRHLAAMVRTYPAQLLTDSDYRLLPMAALGSVLPYPQQCPEQRPEQPSQQHPEQQSQLQPQLQPQQQPQQQHHFFDEWLTQRQLPNNEASILLLFEELCLSFFEINLRLFRIGMISEIHGQNVVVVWHKGKIDGLLFRDHDSLRVHTPWLKNQGLKDPSYVTAPGHTSILYAETPSELLFCLQTLGIQVNLRAIIEALALCYNVDETVLWRTLQQALAVSINRVKFSKKVHTLLHQRLFLDTQWPQKLLIKPLINQTGGTESMPFGRGLTQNPFHALNRKLSPKDQTRSPTLPEQLRFA